ncbi:MAG: TonB-dependent receptor [Gammaproteobacteria bacterium]|nr:TonB-dependent receptor [Gammaproteobacteria bacterium]
MRIIEKSPLAAAISTALNLAGGAVAPGLANAATVEEVIVTGTRITVSDGYASTSPVSVVAQDAIKLTGMTRIEDVLNSLPSVEAAQNAYISNGATGTASIDLRGLGAGRTLVLFNGRRMQPGGVWTEAPDVNQIPAALVERVEVLTGGASATYGADAVAGVVNFIMRRVNGVEISAGWNGFQHNNSNDYIQGKMDARGFTYPTGDSGVDGRGLNFDLIIGSDFPDGRGNATAYASYREGDPLREANRDYSACALNATGKTCGGSATARIPNFFIAPTTAAGAGPVSPYTGNAYDYDQEGFYTLQSNSSLGFFAGNFYNYAPPNYFMRPEKRYSAGVFADYELSERATPYLEVNYNSSKTAAQIAESGTFFAEAYFFPVNDPLFPQAFRNSLATLYPGATEVGIYIGKRNTEGGPRSDVLDHESFRIVLGTKGQLVGNWDYDLFYLYANTTASTTYINDLFLPLIGEAVGPNCATAETGCYQVFTFNGVTPEMAQALGGTAIARARTNLEVAGAHVSGDFGWGLPGAGPVQFVLGFNYGRTEFERIADTIYQQGALAGQGGPTPNIAGHILVSEVFTEASIPLLEDKPLAKALNLSLAYRYSDYNSTGVAETYRYGLDWQPVDRFRVRTGFNRAVRSPSIGEQFSPQQVGLWGGSDPCSGPTPAYTAEQCARTGVTAAQYGNILPSPADQYYQHSGGNPGLEPETADTWTFGVVVNPMDNLTFSVDYWKIEMEDTISTLGAPLILEQCAVFNLLCSAINRLPNGSLWQGSGVNDGFVQNTLQNFGENTWEGIDVAANYSFEALGGSFGVSLMGTRMLTKEVAAIPTDPSATYDCVGKINENCFPSPEWRHSMTIGYDSNEIWSVQAKWRYFARIDYDGTRDTIAKGNLGAQDYLDLSASFRLFENSDIVIGVNNVLDEEPPLLGGTLTTNANTVAGFWDTLGRYVFTKATMRF